MNVERNGHHATNGNGNGHNGHHVEAPIVYPSEPAAVPVFTPKLRQQLTQAAAPTASVRTSLPSERESITHKFAVGGHECYLTVSMFPDGRPGELFLKMSKEGSTMSGFVDAIAIHASLALQHGVPLTTLVKKFVGTRFPPSGHTGNDAIPYAHSITDYVYRWLALKFLGDEEREQLGMGKLLDPWGTSRPIAERDAEPTHADAAAELP